MSQSAAFRIHGVRVSVRTSDAAACDAIAELLRAYLDASADAAIGRRADITVTLTAAAVDFLPRASTEPPLISYGPVSGHRAGSGITLTDGWSQLQVDAQGRRIDGVTHRESLRLPYVFAAVLFNLALQLALRQHGLYYTHAAAVGDPDRPLLLVGNSGAGKTTLALALVRSGLPYLCDDALFLCAPQDQPRVLPFRRPVHLDRGTLALMPWLVDRATGPFERGSRLRWDLDPYTTFPGRVVEGAGAPGMIVLLRRGAVGVGLEPLDATAALQGLLPQSGLVMLGGPACRPHLKVLAKVVRSSANYALSAGGGPGTDPPRLAELLRAAYERGQPSS